MNGKYTNRKQDNQKDPSSSKPISAPYNFVPHANFVHTPDWGTQATHDLPFKDGLSGEITYTLSAHTPLLVGGEQTKATEHEPGKVKPWQDPDGNFAIPGASLKGMLRNVLEIAGFGRMRLVDDGKLSLRDISKSDLGYGPKMAHVRAGWLEYEGSDRFIRPCNFARVERDDLLQQPGCRDKSFWKKPDKIWAKDKYDRWDKHKLAVGFDLDPGTRQQGQRGQKAVLRDGGEHQGTLVFTGQPSPKKHLEFVFYGKGSEPLVVTDPVWQGFLQVHKQSDDWNEHWKNAPRIPVFYLTAGNGQVESLGLAMMYRLPYTLGLHDALGNTSPDHLAAAGSKNGYDLADLLFGVASDEQDDSLRARVSCLTARNTNQSRPVKQEATILNGPKPSFYPNYIRQNTDGKGGLPQGKYFTLMDDHAQLRGFKRYPARKAAMLQKLTDEQKTNCKVQTILQPLPEGACFEGRIVYHNLKPAELGALLWVLAWGGNEQLRHGLGMGKPFGMGQVSLAVDEAHSSVVPNDPANPAKPLEVAARQEYMDVFAKHMEQACRSHGGWAGSLQVASLLAMADPAMAEKFEQDGRALQHMRLGSKPQVNEFVDAKRDNQVLADYAVVTGQYDKALPKLATRANAASPSQPAKPAPVDDTPVDPASLAGNRFVAARLYRDRNNKLFVELNGKPLWVGPKHEKALLSHLPEKLINNLTGQEKPKVWVALSTDNKNVLALKPR